MAGEGALQASGYAQDPRRVGSAPPTHPHPRFPLGTMSRNESLRSQRPCNSTSPLTSLSNKDRGSPGTIQVPWLQGRGHARRVLPPPHKASARRFA